MSFSELDGQSVMSILTFFSTRDVVGLKMDGAPSDFEHQARRVFEGVF